MSEPLTVRVVLIGDSQVGKTSLIHRFVRNSFEKQQKNTVGAVFHTYTEEVDGQTIIMQIWDTAGQEKYRSLGPIYYRNASAGIAVLDISFPDSLQRLQQWIDDFRKFTDNPILYIVGNKTDIENPDLNMRSQIESFASKNSAETFFTSAKTGDNVNELFKTVFSHLVKSGKLSHAMKSRVSSKKEEKVETGCC